MEDSMRYSTLLALGALVLAVVPGGLALAREGSGKEDSPPALKELAARVREVLSASCPEAKVALKGGELTARYRTQTFMVHNRLMTGEYVKQAHEQEGPNKGGFFLAVTFQEEKPDRQAVVPQDLHEPYWTTYINDYPVGSGAGAGYVSVSLAYNGQTPRELLDKIKACIGEASARRKP
jgi:hypothetical protein